MKKVWSKLKERWGISSNFQVAVILVVFAVTGFSTLYVHKHINNLLGIDENTGFGLKIILFIFLILPVYTILFYLWGVILGQRKFITAFIKLKLDLLSFRKLFKNKNQ